MTVDSRVLNQLTEGRYISGEAISGKLNISRAAVWKRVARLRGQGYVIEASPRRGYRLVSRPDQLVPTELYPLLQTQFMGHSIVHVVETGSTTEVARELIRQGAGEGTVVVAERQISGRGRMGRTWETAMGQSIAMSVILYPRFSPQKAPLLSLATALAAARAIQSVAAVQIDLKWPNDLYLSGKKLGGILVEVAAELDRIRWAIDSIGINVNNEFSTGLRSTATSLWLELGAKVSRSRLVASLLAELESVYQRVSRDGFATIAREFEQLDLLQGQRVSVALHGATISGIAAGVDRAGCLIVRDDSGTSHSLFCGEATLAVPQSC